MLAVILPPLGRSWLGLLFTLCLSLLFYSSCSESGNSNAAAPSTLDGRQEMIRALADIASKIDVHQNPFAAKASIDHLNQLIASAANPADRLNAQIRKGIVLLEYGDEPGAVSTLEDVLDAVKDNPKARIPALYWLGVAYLRLAERNNCVNGHTADACIFPLQKSGIHKDKSAAKKAIETFQTFLTESPDNPNYYDGLWLLNIAYMATGEYPGKVPKKWLLPDLKKPDHIIKPFTDVSVCMQISVNNRSGGSIVDDFNNDGLLDLVISGWDIGEDAMYFFKNNGDGTFSDLSQSSGLSQFKGGLNIQQTDFNNDGHLDIWVLRGAWQGSTGPYGEQPNSLMRNNGDGTFTDVTIAAGLWSLCPTQTSTWNDFNHDGWLDLFIGNETQPIGGKNYPCQLYINQQNGTFTEVASEAGIQLTIFAKGVTSGDYDNDGWADLFLSSMEGRKVLLRNIAQAGKVPKFEDATAKAGFASEIYPSFPTFFFDYDNDGWLDLFVCNYDFDKANSHYFAREALGFPLDGSGMPFIYHNNGDGTFTNTSKAVGIQKTAFAMSANFGDFNNDGFLDIYLGTGNPLYQSIVPNKLFMNLGGQKFADATVSSRTGNLQKGHGISIADINNDGHQDIHIDMGGAYRGDAYPNSLYLNPGQGRNNWIYLKLEGTKTNHAGIGAKITLTFKENGSSRMIYRELNSGGSFGSSPLRREIGVGAADIIDEIRIVWPASGATQVLTNVPVNQYLLIREGTEGSAKLPLPSINISSNGSDMPMCAPAI